MEKTQVGGQHYLSMGIQPRELAMGNHWDADSFSALKYLSRFESKNPIEDLKKARHFAEMRRDWAPGPLSVPPKVRLIDYITKNGFSDKPLIRYALHALWDTVYMHDGVRLYSEHLIRKIDDLIASVEAQA